MTKPTTKKRYSIEFDKIQYLAKTGENAVNASIGIQSLKSANSVDLNLFGNIRHVNGKVFKLENELWSEQDLDESLKILKIEYGSDAYFNLYSLLSDYEEVFQLGDKVKFSFDQLVVWIDEEGENDLSSDDLKRKLKL